MAKKYIDINGKGFTLVSTHFSKNLAKTYASNIRKGVKGKKGKTIRSPRTARVVKVGNMWAIYSGRKNKR